MHNFIRLKKRVGVLGANPTLQKILRSNITLVSVVTVIICLFFYRYIATGNRIFSGDFDYYAQMYEAFRISVLHYGQFPSWNPWMSGGLPLYTNPQFGLISIQSLLVLLFGTIYGLKLAYVAYGMAGFWGMYILGRKVFKASTFRSLLVSFMWVFGAFFAYHAISHFTFALFFLLPWLVFLIYNRKQKYAWLWFALLESLIVLSSLHYAFLLTSFAVAIYFTLSLFRFVSTGRRFKLSFHLSKEELTFISKSLGLFILLSSYRIITTFIYVHNNSTPPRPPEINPTISVLLQALFLPVETILKVPTHLQWGWGEYAMYTGAGTGVALLICIITFGRDVYRKKNLASLISNVRALLPLIIIAAIGFVLALGRFSHLSPFALLHHIPGFSDTRVPSRWLILVVFAILAIFLSWKKHTVLINTLLALSVLELFLMFGPPRTSGADQYQLPRAVFSNTFSEYDNGKQHLDANLKPDHSYFHTTQENKGQVYSDDSIIDTLDHVYLTSKCGQNINPSCRFVLSDNAAVTYWSPNKIIIRRTKPGPIALNMNVDYGWQVNGAYPFTDIKRIRPERLFTLPDDNQPSYTLKYAPKLSPSWLAWKIAH